MSNFWYVEGNNDCQIDFFRKSQNLLMKSKADPFSAPFTALKYKELGLLISTR